MRDIGKNIKQLRIQKNMTQDALAEKLFVTRQTVSNYETGKSRPDIHMLMKIAEVLEADIHTVLYGPAPKQDRQDEFARLAIGSVATLLLCLLTLLTKNWVRSLYYDFYSVPMYLHTFLLQPVFYLFLGWTLLQGLGVLLKTKPPRFSASVFLRRGILIFLVLCLILMLPTIIWTVIDTIQLQQARAVGESHASSFSFLPVWDDLARKLSWILAEYPATPAFFGAELWLCGSPVKKSP